MEFHQEMGKRCLYCKKELDLLKWDSQWDPLHHDVHHYKSIKCSCGKKNWVKMDFDGSGDDQVIQGCSSLESTIRKVREK